MGAQHVLQAPGELVDDPGELGVVIFVSRSIVYVPADASGSASMVRTDSVPARQRASEASLRQRLQSLRDENQRLREENHSLKTELALAYG